MASKVEGEKFRNLICPMCLEIFKNATLLGCGHTFCKGCLKAYDEQHNDLDYIVCPVCREVTHLGQDRVAGLTPNYSLKGIEDERLGTNDSPPNVCPLHKADYKTLFCEVCTEFICITCLIEKHIGHKIMKKDEFESELKKTRDALVQKGLIQKYELENCAQARDAKQDLADMFGPLSTVEKEIRNACRRKRTMLQEDEQKLLKQVNDTRKDLDKQLKCSMANNQEFVANINCSIKALMGSMIEQLDSVKLKAHQMKCNDLENSSKETNARQANIEESLADVKRRVEGVQFCPADEERLALGYLKFREENTPGQSKYHQASLQVRVQGKTLVEEF